MKNSPVPPCALILGIAIAILVCSSAKKSNYCSKCRM